VTDDGDTLTGEHESMERRAALLLSRAEDFRRHGDDGSADAALALAEKIMLKFNLDSLIIGNRAANDGQQPVEQPVESQVKLTGIYRRALIVKFDDLVQRTSFAIKSFIERGGSVDKLHLVGYEAEVRQFVTLITSLNLQAIGRMNLWWQDYPLRAELRGMAGYKERRSFVYNFIEGAIERIELARQTALRGSKSGTALVVSDRMAAVHAFVAEHYDLKPDRQQLKTGTQRAINDGRMAGRHANTGDPAVGNRRRIGS
jgi:hypothetical protein